MEGNEPWVCDATTLNHFVKQSFFTEVGRVLTKTKQ